VVPDGFALTAAAFRLHLAQAGLDRTIYDELDRLDLRDVATLAAVARGIRERVAAAPLPAAVVEQLQAAYRTLSARYGDEATDVAARSSATAVDLPSASFRHRDVALSVGIQKMVRSDLGSAGVINGIGRSSGARSPRRRSSWCTRDADGHRVGAGRPERRAVHRPGPPRDGPLAAGAPDPRALAPPGRCRAGRRRDLECFPRLAAVSL
jgi:hypothetical protein